MKEFIEIPFGAKDSELGGWEYNIPEGYTASIESGKIIIKKEENEDEKIRKELIDFFSNLPDTDAFRGIVPSKIIAWLKKQDKENIIEALRLEYERGKADALQEQRKEWTAEDLLNRNQIADILQEYNRGDLIKWLKKQGESKFEQCIQKGDKIVTNEDGTHFNVSQLERVSQKATDTKEAAKKFLKTAGIMDKNGELSDEYRLEKQGEQKPTDKIESHFHIEKGKWYMCIKNNVGMTKGNVYYGISDGYIIDDGGKKYNCNNWAVFQKYLRLWTIQDAKDGDILVDGNFVGIFKENSYNPSDNSGCMYLYCSFDIDNDKFYLESGGYNPTYFYPATKEQRNLLFQKMKEAGYMWDADKKELKKISQEYPLTTDECIKPTWGEEDNGHVLIISDIIEDKKNEQLYHIGIKVLNNEIAWLKSLKDRVQPQPQKEWSEDDEEKLNQLHKLIVKKAYEEYEIDTEDETLYGKWLKLDNWLNSLKYRVQPKWKPSDEQIEAIRIAGVVGTANDSWAMNILKDMYLQLNGL